MRNSHKNNAGFTIVELAIVMIIFGLVSSTMFYALKLYSQGNERGHTEEALATSQAAALEFFSRHGRYPCPANPALGPGHPAYGVENCALTPVDGQRDADNADGDDDPATGLDEILIGAVPFRTMLDPDNNAATLDGIIDVPLTENLTVDGWGRKLRYAVTKNLTDDATFNETWGVIDVVDEFNFSVLGMPETAHLIVVSAGENGEGGYTREGEEVGNCSTSIKLDDPGLPTPSFGANEVTNCNDTDGKFLSGLRNDQERYRNDDKVQFLMSQTSTHWIYSGVAPDGQLQVANTNPRNVGIGVQEPEERLHILGDIKADRILAEGFCDPDSYEGAGTICMPTSVIAGNEAAMTCPAPGTAVTAIEQNSVNTRCQPVFPSPASPPVGYNPTCPTGQVMVGLSNVTGAICEALP